MPIISRNFGNLEAEGPRLEILVMPAKSVLALLGDQPPPVLRLEAMIDTGAATSVIQEGLANTLGIFPTGRVTISTPATSNVPCAVYSLQILFPDDGHLVPRMAQVVAAPMQGQDVQFLIGRDILRNAVLVYQGHCDSFTLSF